MKTKVNGKSNGHPVMNRVQSSIMNYIHNETTLRADLIARLTGQDSQRKDVDKECGYPEQIEAQDYKDMYDREGIATRIVTIYPKETWAMPPEIYETESVKQQTPFEKAWKSMNKRLKIIPKMELLDKLAGIGRYGVMLLGFKDGRELDKPVKKNSELIFVRSLPELYADIKSYETDTRSPRYGQPTEYNIYIAGIDSTQIQTATSSIPTPSSKDKIMPTVVHWTRVHHVADNIESSEIFGVPRLQSTFNRCEDLRKILGADGEGFWKGGFPGLSLETHPNLEAIEFGDEEKEATKDEIRKYMMGLQRYIATVGMTVKSLAPQLADPHPHFRTQLEAIAVSLDVPLRVFMGSEEGKLASAQDMRTWNKRLSRRQVQFVNPYIIEPFFERMFLVGALPEPEELLIHWPDLNAPTENDKAVTSQKIADALLKYAQGNVYLVIPPKEYLTVVLGFPMGQVEQIIKSAGGEKKMIAKLTKLAEQAAAPSFGGSSKVGGAKRKPKASEGAGKA